MGRKQARRGKHLRFCIAVLILLAASGCAFLSRVRQAPAPAKSQASDGVPAPAEKPAGEQVQKSVARPEQEVREHLAQGRKLFDAGRPAVALGEYEKALALKPDRAAMEECFFFMGLIWAHPANPRRDYRKSAFYMKKLARLGAGNPFAEQAEIVAEILRENDESAKTIKKLKSVIEGSKRVDIGIENKKRVQAQ